MEYYSQILNLTVHGLAPKGELEKLPRRERERLARRGEIVVAGRNVFARKGYHDATLDDVADELCDVALTALCALEHLRGHDGGSVDVLADRLARTLARAHLTPTTPTD